MYGLRIMLVLIVAVLFCGLLVTPAISGTVPAAKSINLVTGSPQTGNLQTPHMTINYKYTLSNNQLDLAGDFKFADFLVMQASAGLKTFSMQVFLLDAKGKVMKRANVKFGTSSAAGKAFSAKLSLPAGIKAIAFYYSGQTAAGTEGASTSFWYDPSSR